jgi:hypothetical protein
MLRATEYSSQSRLWRICNVVAFGGRQQDMVVNSVSEVGML